MITRTFSSLRWDVIASLSVLGLLVAGCGGSQQGSGEQGSVQEESTEPVVGSFVGEVSDFVGDPKDVPFVAVVAEEPEEGGESREARAYLCDGESINEWLWVGSAEGNEFDISSDNGAQMQGNLTPEAATGTATLADGSSFSFEAPLATGVAGLYDLTQNADGSFSGTSERGGLLAGQLAGVPEGEPSSITGTITPPDGEPQEFEAPLANVDEPGDFRAIVQPDMRVKGGKKGRETTSYYIFTLF